MKNDKKILWGAIILYVIVMTGASLWKYELFRYNAIDLAYYNQVFWKTIHGEWFGLTIHPHLSIGDHVEPFLLLLAPLYALLPDARTLLFLQSLVLGLTALPIYSLASFLIMESVRKRSAASPPPTIAKVSMEESPGGGEGSPLTLVSLASAHVSGGESPAEHGDLPRHRSVSPERGGGALLRIPLLFALLWLANPLVQNINVMEFHILPFALPFLFLAILAYEKKHVGHFILWSLLALTVREDVFLAIGAFALLALIDVFKKKRSALWIFIPLLLALPWFFLTQKIASLFAAGGAYKFLVYYAWLGNTFTEIVANVFRHPLVVLAHIATGKSLLLFLALGIPFLFLFVLRPRYLLLALPALAQQLLASYGGDPLVAQTHYVTLLLPGLVLATMATIIHVPQWVDVAWFAPQSLAQGERARLERSERASPSRSAISSQGKSITSLRSESATATNNEKSSLFPIPLLLTIATLYGMVTPLGPLYGIVTERVPQEERSARASILSRIPPNASVATTESFLTSLSRRDNVFLLRYIFAGETQFGGASYSLPESTEYILLDRDDAVAYKVDDLEKVRTALAPFGVVATEGTFVLLKRGTGALFVINDKQVQQSCVVALAHDRAVDYRCAPSKSSE